MPKLQERQRSSRDWKMWTSFRKTKRKVSYTQITIQLCRAERLKVRILADHRTAPTDFQTGKLHGSSLGWMYIIRQKLQEISVISILWASSYIYYNILYRLKSKSRVTISSKHIKSNQHDRKCDGLTSHMLTFSSRESAKWAMRAITLPSLIRLWNSH